MDIQTTEIERRPDRHAAERALATLRTWAESASDVEIATLDPVIGRLRQGPRDDYPDLARTYPASFLADAAYRATLPDLQNGPGLLIRGAAEPIAHVGISGFRLPLRYLTRAGGEVVLPTVVTGTVSLAADRKGINMSRIMRSFYAHAEKAVSFGVIDAALDDYQADLDSPDARIQMRLQYPMRQESLRSGLSGWQYYDLVLEVVEQGGTRRRLLHLDYVYSSTCPCSLELSEHARMTRAQLATPHSQRSVARLSLEVDPTAPCLWFEDLVELCREAVPTETQVMVKREDEQAFAELNAANPIFVEDAARLFSEALSRDPRTGDHRVVCSHQESLHSHDAVAVLTQGPLFAATPLDPHLFPALRHAG
jgi:GTP cyclohydrolase I